MARKLRPLSGEIMAPAVAGTVARSAGAVDAEFISLPKLASSESATPAAHGEPPVDPDGMDILKRSAADSVRPREKGGVAFWLFGLALAAGAFWVSGGHALVRELPQVMVAREGPLHLSALNTRTETHAGRTFLIIDGEIANSGETAVDAPRISINVATAGGRTVRYFLGTRGETVAPGGSFAFSSRLEAPKTGVEGVSVTFHKGDN